MEQESESVTQQEALPEVVEEAPAVVEPEVVASVTETSAPPDAVSEPEPEPEVVAEPVTEVAEEAPVVQAQVFAALEQKVEVESASWADAVDDDDDLPLPSQPVLTNAVVKNHARGPQKRPKPKAKAAKAAKPIPAHLLRRTDWADVVAPNRPKTLLSAIAPPQANGSQKSKPKKSGSGNKGDSTRRNNNKRRNKNKSKGNKDGDSKRNGNKNNRKNRRKQTQGRDTVAEEAAEDGWDVFHTRSYQRLEKKKQEKRKYNRKRNNNNNASSSSQEESRGAEKKT